MSFDAQRLYELLPAVYRIRDARQGEPLKELLSVIAEQVAVLEENLDQLYDDQFIETCADWVVPYLGDLIGYRPLHSVAPRISSPRAEVANTIAYRRRKGTATVLEQLARDVTGWPARVVEFFQLLATTQFINHLRPGNHYSPDLRRWEPLERLNTAFGTVAHTVDVRDITSGRGRHNVPNIGIFLWRLNACSLTESPAVPWDEASPGDHRYLFSPLKHNTQLFTFPVAEDEITHLADRMNVPMPISRRVLKENLGDYYGPDKSFVIYRDGDVVPPGQIVVCHLGDAVGGAWAHDPPEDDANTTEHEARVAVDPVLGRVAFPDSLAPQTAVHVTYHYGFSADLGGGEYERRASFDAELEAKRIVTVPQLPGVATVQDALDVLGAHDGVVEIVDNERYVIPAPFDLANGQRIELRAANQRRPLLDLADGCVVQGDEDSRLTLNGLLIAGGPLEVPLDAGLRRLTLRHCTLVPGRRLTIDGQPRRAGQPSLIVRAAGVAVEIDRCIVGPIQLAENSTLVITGSIVDATDPTRVAFSGPIADDAALSAGGSLSVESSTIIGKIWTREVETVSNSILLARNTEGEAGAPIRSDRKQAGCVRFSYVAPEARVPRQYRCQPTLAIRKAIDRATADKGRELSESEEDAIAGRVIARLQPVFTDRRYGQPAYAQLAGVCPVEIRTGAEDESEMGVFRHLYQPQRESNLRARLNEYLRFGLDAGIFYET